MARPKKNKAKSTTSFDKPQEQQTHPDQWQQDLNPNRMAGQNFHSSTQGSDRPARTAADIKALTGKLAELTVDQLAAIPIVPAGTRLKQGAVYLDLRHPAPAPFTATGEMIAQEINYYTPKAEVPYEFWNRIVELLSPGPLSETAAGGEGRPFSPERGKQEAAVEKTRARESHGDAPQDPKIDEAIAESFPASDPPSWTTGREKKSSPD
jgi:hypothetical protein